MLRSGGFVLLAVLIAGGYNGVSAGSRTSIDLHPYQVAIDFNGTLACGGALIDVQWVLTSASCVSWKNISDLTIRVGASYGSFGGGQKFNVARMVTHPQFGSYISPESWNAALLQIDDTITESRTVKTVKLASKQPSQGEMLILTSYGGHTQADVEDSSSLHRMQVSAIPAYDYDLCKSVLSDVPPYDELDGPVFCAGGAGDGICVQTDAGSPLVNSLGELAGISNNGYGSPCDTEGVPTVFTSASNQNIAQWIWQTINALITEKAVKHI